MSALVPASPDVRAAYRHCEQVTRSQARNFSYGIALLPGDKRRALSAVYALARRIDDIGDGDLPPADKLAALAQARAQVAELAAGPKSARPGDPVLLALSDAVSRFPIPLAAFGELIEGCEADVRGIAYRTFDELERYCRCVAGSIGRLSLGVFGTADPAAAAPLADALGVALQLTNILRDIREDLANGRVYLPAEDLEKFGCTLAPDRLSRPDGQRAAEQRPGGQRAAEQRAGGQRAAEQRAGEQRPSGPGPGGLGPDEPWLGDTASLERLIRFEVERAQSWYAVGLRLMPMLDWRSAACAGAMADIYLRLLGYLAATPGEVLQRRMSLPAGEKIMVAVRSLAGRTPRAPAGVPPALVPPALVPPAMTPRGPASPVWAASSAQTSSARHPASRDANGGLGGMRAREEAVPAGEAVHADGAAPAGANGQAEVARPVAEGAP